MCLAWKSYGGVGNLFLRSKVDGSVVVKENYVVMFYLWHYDYDLYVVLCWLFNEGTHDGTT